MEIHEPWHTTKLGPMSYYPDLLSFGAEQETTMAFQDPAFSSYQTYDPYTQDTADCQPSQLAINPTHDYVSAGQVDLTAWGCWSEGSHPLYQPALEQDHLVALTTQCEHFPSQTVSDSDGPKNMDSELGRRMDRFQAEVEHRISQVEDRIAQVKERVSQVEDRILQVEKTTRGFRSELVSRRHDDLAHADAFAQTRRRKDKAMRRGQCHDPKVSGMGRTSQKTRPGRSSVHQPQLATVDGTYR
jgi:hypothetical protein